MMETIGRFLYVIPRSNGPWESPGFMLQFDCFYQEIATPVCGLARNDIPNTIKGDGSSAPYHYNVTNRAGLGSIDKECTVHELSAATRRLAAHEDFG